jgi:hypothetical protein
LVVKDGKLVRFHFSQQQRREKHRTSGSHRIEIQVTFTAIGKPRHSVHFTGATQGLTMQSNRLMVSTYATGPLRVVEHAVEDICIDAVVACTINWEEQQHW